MKNVILATGGTGGHIYSARGTAEALRHNGFNPIVIADENYTNYIDQTEYKIIKTGKISKNPIKLAKTLLLICAGIIQTVPLMIKKKPVAVIGFGSYASFPTMVTAVICRKKIILHEQNSVFGIVNKMLLPFARTIAVTYKDTYEIKDKYKCKIQHVGTPIRDKIKKLENLEYSLPKENEKTNIFIVGGSGGSRFLSQQISKVIASLDDDMKRKIIITQQCRKEDVEGVIKLYEESRIEANAQPFFHNIEEIITNAHLIISRAGSSSISEFTVAGKPLILVPFPFAVKEHQLKNAQDVAKSGGAIVVTEKEFNADNFKKTLVELLNRPQMLKEMAKHSKEYGIVDADERIAKLVEKIDNNNCKV